MPNQARDQGVRPADHTNLIRLPPRRRDPGEAIPQFTWAQLEAQLTALRPDRARLAAQLVTVLRARSVHRTPEDLLREMLCTVWTVLETEA